LILPKQMLESQKIVDVRGEGQMQPCGVDITLKEAYSFKGPGKIDYDNKERKISDVEPIAYESDQVHLKPGSYKVVFNEYVRIPADVAGMCLPRSSLLRCGATLECALWDPGYEGRSEALLLVKNEHGLILKRDAKIGQMVFIRLFERAGALYDGVYKGENK